MRIRLYKEGDTSIAFEVEVSAGVVEGGGLYNSGQLSVGYSVTEQTFNFVLNGRNKATVLFSDVLDKTGAQAEATFEATRTYIGEIVNFKPASGGSGAVAWGGITGTLSDQTDLQSELDSLTNAIVPKIEVTDLRPIVEEFSYTATEGSQTLIGGRFWGGLQTLGQGGYENILSMIRSVNIGNNESCTFHVAVYDQSTLDRIIYNTFSLTNADNSGSRELNYVINPTYQTDSNRRVYVVIGANDFVATPTVRVFRKSANNLNNADFAFRFTQTSGNLPTNLASATLTADNTILHSALNI